MKPSYADFLSDFPSYTIDWYTSYNGFILSRLILEIPDFPGYTINQYTSSVQTFPTIDRYSSYNETILLGLPSNYTGMSIWIFVQTFPVTQ